MADTLDGILAKARADLASGARAPHCYRAHVPGRGYVNDGSLEVDRAEYLRQLDRTVESEIENMRYAPAYAERGYTQPAKGVLIADWNPFPRGLDTELEAAGYAIEWSDEWAECDDCARTFRTSADSYAWQPSGNIFEHDRAALCLCVECLQEWAEGERRGELAELAESEAE